MVKIISRGQVSPETQTTGQPQAPVQDQSTVDPLGRLLMGLVPDIAAGIADIPFTTGKLLSSALTGGPTAGIAENFWQKQGYSPEFSQALSRGPGGAVLNTLLSGLGQQSQQLGIPTSGEEVKELTTKLMPERYQEGIKQPTFPEEIAQKVVRTLPSALAMGGFSWAAQAPVIGGAIPEVAVKRLGGGQGWQLAANMLGSGLTSLAQHVGSASNIEKWATNAYKSFYKEAEEVAPKVTANVDPIVSTINNVERQASEQSIDLHKQMQPELIDILDKLQMTRGKTSIGALQSAKRKVNNMIGKFSGWQDMFNPEAQAQKDLYKQVLGSIKQEMKNTAIEHPEWGTPFYNAEELFTATHARGYVGKMLEKIAPGDVAALSPAVKKLLTGSFGNLGKIMKTVGWTLGAGLAGKEMMKYYNMYSKSPIIRQKIHELSVDAMESNTPSFMRGLKDLDAMTQQVESKPTYKIIRRGSATNQ